MAKKYSDNRKSEVKQKKDLTKYEWFLFKKVRQEFKLKTEILKIRNSLTEKECQELEIPNKQISRAAIHKTIKKIEEKLEIKDLFRDERPVFKQKWSKIEPWRLHGKCFTVKVKDISDKYLNKLKSKQSHDIRDNNTIELYKKKLVIYSNKDFFGENPDKAVDKSQLYWKDFLRKIEREYDIDIFKFGVEIYEFRNHIAHINNPIAEKELSLKKGLIKIKNDQGEDCFVIDNSFNLKELEAVHVREYKTHANRVHRELEDYANNPNSLTASELTLRYEDMLEKQNKLLDNMNRITEEIQKSFEITNVNQGQVQLLIKSQQLQAIQIKSINDNMNNLIQMLTPKKTESKTFEPSMDYFI